MDFGNLGPRQRDRSTGYFALTPGQRFFRHVANIMHYFLNHPPHTYSHLQNTATLSAPLVASHPSIISVILGQQVPVREGMVARICGSHSCVED